MVYANYCGYHMGYGNIRVYGGWVSKKIETLEIFDFFVFVDFDFVIFL